MPFDEIVKAAGAEIHSNGAAITEVSFSFTPMTQIPENWGGLRVSRAESVDTPSAKLPIVVEIEHSENGLEGKLEFRSDLHGMGQIERLHSNWQSAFRRLISIA